MAQPNPTRIQSDTNLTTLAGLKLLSVQLDGIAVGEEEIVRHTESGK